MKNFTNYLTSVLLILLVCISCQREITLNLGPNGQEENEETQAQLSKQAFDLALLSQGLLTGAELTEFVNRSVNLI